MSVCRIYQKKVEVQQRQGETMRSLGTTIEPSAAAVSCYRDNHSTALRIDVLTISEERVSSTDTQSFR
jgi:hypothetical protein